MKVLFKVELSVAEVRNAIRKQVTAEVGAAPEGYEYVVEGARYSSIPSCVAEAKEIPKPDPVDPVDAGVLQ